MAFQRAVSLLSPKSHSGHLTWDGLVLWLVGGKLSARPGPCDDPVGRGRPVTVTSNETSRRGELL